MAKNVVALEISSSAIKLVVGYVLDQNVVVLHAAIKDLPNNAVVGEDIKEPDVVSLAIADIIKDGENRLKCDIKDVVLVLPPVGFEVFENTQSTNIVSSTGIIAEVDVRNVISMLRKDRYDHNNKIVDIIPQNYLLDQNRIFANTPIGESSSTLQMRAFVHTISPEVMNTFSKIVKQLGLNITKYVVAPYGVGLLFKDYRKLPEQYLLVDYGAEYTTVSTISNGLIYGSTFFQNGSETLTESIKNAFNVTDKEAKKLKEVFGLDSTVSTFHPTISKSQVDGKELNYTIEDLNNIVSNYLMNYTRDLRRTLKTVLNDESFTRNIPLVFIGGGSTLRGFEEFIVEQKLSDVILFPTLKSMGARDITFASCLGAIKVGDTQSFDEDKDTTRIVTPLTREKKKKVYSETEDKL